MKPPLMIPPSAAKRSRALPSIVLGALLVLASAPGAQADPLPAGWTASGVEPVGYTDMQGRPAFKMTVREKDGRWYLYTGHFWHPGWSVVDVTDPARPEVLRFVEASPNTWTLQVDLAGDLLVTALERPFANFGGDPHKPFDEGVVFWDVSEPANPQKLGQFRTGGTGTHRNFYAGGRYVHLAAGMPGYRGNIYVIVDIADPARPKEAGRWWLPGQHEAGGETLGLGADGDPAGPHDHAAHGHGFCGTDADVSLHGPPYVVGNLAWLSYGSAGVVVLDISDVAAPRQIGRLDFSPPFHSRFGVHGVLPLPDKGLAFANSESVDYEKGALHHASIIDISNPARPVLLALFPEPVPPPGAPYRDFFAKGGWRGPHNINHLQHNPDVERQGDRFYIAHFNAGLRVYDVSNPRLPRETGYFLPPEPTKRHGPMPEGKLVLQTEDVVVDRRGYIYISHKNQGVWILKNATE